MHVAELSSAESVGKAVANTTGCVETKKQNMAIAAKREISMMIHSTKFLLSHGTVL